MNVSIRRAREGDFAVVTGLLATSDLPIDDLVPAHLAFAAEQGGKLLGAIGLEDFGDVGLLRSLIVAQAARSTGVGARLVMALEDDARSRRIRELWLLTVDADAYFVGLGYAARERDDAPTVIRATAQFSELCPSTAVLMSKRL